MTMPTPPVVKPQRFTVKTKDGTVIGKAELRAVAVHLIKLDSAYQRDTNTTWIAEHMPFDAQKAGAVVLSGRLGGPFCVDGGHRVALARESGMAHVNAYVIEGLTQRDEARLFTRYQRERRNLTSFALYRADIVAGDPDTLAMDRAVRVSGFQIGKSPKNQNTITAIDSLRYIQSVGGEDLIARTLQLVRKFWIGEEKALSGQVLKGIGMFLIFASSRPPFRQTTLDRVLNKTPPVKLIRLAMSVSHKRGATPAATPANVAEAVVEEYDKLVTEPGEKLGALTIGSRVRPKRAWSKE